MRSYLVIPAGTPVLRVEASAPGYAASKAKRGKAEHHEGETLVVPTSTTWEPPATTAAIPGQLAFGEA